MVSQNPYCLIRGYPRKENVYSNERKSKAALTMIEGDRTVNEIASEYGIHVSQVNRWKKETIERLPDFFGNKNSRKSKDIEKEKDRLYQQIRELQIEAEFLKNTGHLL